MTKKTLTLANNEAADQARIKKQKEIANAIGRCGRRAPGYDRPTRKQVWYLAFLMVSHDVDASKFENKEFVFTRDMAKKAISALAPKRDESSDDKVAA